MHNFREFFTNIRVCFANKHVIYTELCDTSEKKCVAFGNKRETVFLNIVLSTETFVLNEDWFVFSLNRVFF